MVKVAIMGFGTIGSGVYEVIRDNNELLKRRINSDIEVSKILDLRDFKGTEFESLMVKNFEDIENDKEIDIVVETMGGTNPAYDFVKRSILAGKSVVTSNKALVAAHGTELYKLSKENNVNFLFEASVGGGIPIIRTLNTALAGEHIREITGILNGTTNFILTKMDKEGEDFSVALKTAQDLGYAERNPEADVEGHDTCRKIAILSSLAGSKEVNYEDIYVEGITKIDTADFEYAKKMNASIKLLGSAKLAGDKLEAYVFPTLVSNNDILSGINDVFNGIMVDGNMLGKSMYYGSGAGKLPTASAVVADIIEASNNLHKSISKGWSDEKAVVENIENTSHRYFVRIKGCDAKNIEANEKLLKSEKVYKVCEKDEFGILTDCMKEKDFLDILRNIDDVIKFIRAREI